MVSWNAIATGNCSVFPKNKEPLMDDYRKFVEKKLADMDYLEEKSKSLSLNTTLADIKARLQQNSFPNEQAISQGIVLRVLRELGWDTYDTNVVWPEYQTAGSGRADFALCHPPSKPRIFIEVKRVGKAENAAAIEQALLYAFKSGVPFVVLTDGRTWSFYLPAEQGDYDERRVYKLDLYERSSDEAGTTFRHYLAHESVASHESLQAARAEYHNLNRRSQAKAAIPEAWRELVQKRDGSLIEILGEAVESKVGFPPNAAAVAAFLDGLAASKPPPLPVSKSVSTSAATASTPQLVIRGERYDCRTGKDAMVTVLRVLANSDPSFLEHCAQHPDARGHKRRYIARTPEELHPSRADQRRHHEKLPGGWLVWTKFSKNEMRKIIGLAAETAGLKLNVDIKLPPVCD